MIIKIAHRLNTIKNCDLIFRFEKSQLVAQGAFNKNTKSIYQICEQIKTDVKLV